LPAAKNAAFKKKTSYMTKTRIVLVDLIQNTENTYKMAKYAILKKITKSQNLIRLPACLTLTHSLTRSLTHSPTHSLP